MKETKQRLHPALGAAPQESLCSGVELINHGQVLLAFEDRDLVNANLRHTIQASVGQTVFDDELDRPKDRVLARFEDVSRFLP